MKKPALVVIAALLSVLLYATPSLAQEAEHQEHEQHEEHAEAADHEEHGEEHGGLHHHKNDLGIFVGVTDEHGHASEPTLGIDYRRLVGESWAVGALFDYAGGDLRDALFAASVTWLPIGGLQLTAAPGIEFHRGRGSSGGCGCNPHTKSEDPEQIEAIDEDESYFVFRLGAGWNFPVGRNYGITPQINLDLVDSERVWVYGLVFTFAW